jgi:hypothetical protein
MSLASLAGPQGHPGPCVCESLTLRPDALHRGQVVCLQDGFFRLIGLDSSDLKVSHVRSAELHEEVDGGVLKGF